MKRVFLKTESDSLNSDESDDDSHRFGGNKIVPHDYFMIKSRGGVFWSMRTETDNRERAIFLSPHNPYAFPPPPLPVQRDIKRHVSRPENYGNTLFMA
nr:hypothetical protein [uncultured Methanoregula sp.]